MGGGWWGCVVGGLEACVGWGGPVWVWMDGVSRPGLSSTRLHQDTSILCQNQLSHNHNPS